jgi:hypothetical protein
MKEFLIILGVVTLVATVTILFRYTRTPGVVVLGREEAMADAAERLRLQQATRDDLSPLPIGEYDASKGEHRLLGARPAPLDFALAATCRDLAAAPEDQRAQARRRISKNEFYTLLTFAQRAAVHGIRERNLGWVRDGLAAIALIERERIDYRNIPLVLSLLHHAVSKNGAEPAALFEQAASLSGRPIADVIRQFVESSPEDKDLNVWGFAEVSTEAGPEIVARGFSKFAPSVDLTSLIIDASTVIEQDNYVAESVAIAEDLPEVWLQAGQSRSVPELKGLRAGARVTGRLRPEAHQSYASQQLFLFVAELEDESSVSRLLERTATLRPKHYALLVAGRGPLVAVLAGSSFIEGVPAFETTQSLERFRAGIDLILKRYAE